MRIALLFVLVSLNFSAFAQMEYAENIWFNGEKTSKIKIFKADNNLYYGKIIWLKDPLENGRVRKDFKNPDERLRDRNLMDLIVLKDFKISPDNNNVLEGGSIYDPKTGKTYCGKITVHKNHLQLKGHICGWSWLSKTTTWQIAN